MLTDVVKTISHPALFRTESADAVKLQLARFLSLLMDTKEPPVQNRISFLLLLSMTSRLSLRIYRSHMLVYDTLKLPKKAAKFPKSGKGFSSKKAGHIVSPSQYRYPLGRDQSIQRRKGRCTLCPRSIISKI